MFFKISRKLSILVLLLSLGFLTSCKDVKIENGKIPAEFLEVAQGFTGTFHGEFLNQLVDLDVSIDQNNVLHIVPSRDLFGESCETSVNLLQRLSLKEKNKNYYISSAVVALDPGRCGRMFEGRMLYFYPRYEEGQMTSVGLQVLEETRSHRECHWSGNPPREYCEYKTIEYYYTGRFTRVR